MNNASPCFVLGNMKSRLVHPSEGISIVYHIFHPWPQMTDFSLQKLMRVLGPIATEISFVGNFWSPFAIILGASIMCPTEKGHKRVCCRQDERQPWGNGDKLGHLPSPTYGYLPYSAKWLLSFNKLQAGALPALPFSSTRGHSTLDGVAAGSKFAESLIRAVFSKL